MPRYHTSLTLPELDPIIKGDLPWIDLLPFNFRHNGERDMERFFLRRHGMVIRDRIERQNDQVFIELHARYGIVLFVTGAFCLLFMAPLVLADDVTINGEPATLQSRSIHLLLALLFPALVFGAFHFQMGLWLSRIKRDMKLERVSGWVPFGRPSP